MSIEVSEGVQYVLDSLMDKERLVEINDAIFYRNVNRTNRIINGVDQLMAKLLANDYSLTDRIYQMLEVEYAWDVANQEGLRVERGYIEGNVNYEYEWYLMCNEQGDHYLEHFINRVYIRNCDVDKLVHDLLEIPEGRRIVAGEYDGAIDHLMHKHSILPENYIDEVCAIDYRESLYIFIDRYSVEDYDYLLLLLNYHLDEIVELYNLESKLLQEGFDYLFELFGMSLRNEQASQVLA